MKLTDLRQAETSKEEMKFVKGGTEGSAVCGNSCACECKCTSGSPSETTQSSNQSSNRNNGDVSWYIGTALSILSGGALN